MTVFVSIKGTPASRGSGVWLGKNGYLATCYHVVKGITDPLVIGVPYPTVFSAKSSKSNIVISGPARVFDATLIAFDESMDVAILKATQRPGQMAPLMSGDTGALGLPPEQPVITKGA